MTRRPTDVTTDGVTARIIKGLGDACQHALREWAVGSDDDHEIGVEHFEGMYPVVGGTLMRLDGRCFAGRFTMLQGTVAGASVRIDGSMPETSLLTACGGDAGEVLGWPLLRGLHIIDATNIPRINGRDAHTRFRIEAPVERLC